MKVRSGVALLQSAARFSSVLRRNEMRLGWKRSACGIRSERGAWEQNRPDIFFRLASSAGVGTPSEEEFARQMENVKVVPSTEGDYIGSPGEGRDEGDGSCDVLSAAHVDKDGNVTFEMTKDMDWEKIDWEAMERECGITEGNATVDASMSELFKRLDELPDDATDFEITFDAETGNLDVDLTEQNQSRDVSKQSEEPAEHKSKLSSFVASESWQNAAPKLPQHAPNPEKPGMQRRVAQLEAEMERIVIEETHRNTDWKRARLDVDEVGLSHNVRDLTVFYSQGPDPNCPPRVNQDGSVAVTVARDEDSAISSKASRKQAARSRRTVREVSVAVRSAIASQMDLKYAPRVHFRETSHALERKGKGLIGRKAELDSLFDQIEAERHPKHCGRAS